MSSFFSESTFVLSRKFLTATGPCKYLNGTIFEKFSSMKLVCFKYGMNLIQSSIFAWVALCISTTPLTILPDFNACKIIPDSARSNPLNNISSEDFIA